MRVVLAGALAWVVAMLCLRALGLPERVAVPGVTRYVAAEAFVVAGLFRLLCWHLTRDRASLRSAAALCTMGFGLPVLSAVAPWSADGIHVDSTAALGRVALIAVVFVIVGAGRTRLDRRRWRSPSDSGPPPPWQR